MFYLLENYQKLNFAQYLNHVSYRFKHRKHTWKYQDYDINPMLEKEFQQIDSWCFSSQYYFVMMLYQILIFTLILGIEIVYIQSYNPLFDIASFFMLIIISLGIYLIKKLGRHIIRVRKIWAPESEKG